MPRLPPLALPDTEQASPRFLDLDAWPTITQVEALYESQFAALAAIRPALPGISRAADAAIIRLGHRAAEADNPMEPAPGRLIPAPGRLIPAPGRLIYVGAGSSARLAAQDGSELEPTFDWPAARLLLLIAGGPGALLQAVEGAEDDAEAGHAAIKNHAIGTLDVVIALAASGATPFTVASLEAARAAGALCIGVANTIDAPLLAASDHPILVETGAEPIAGSTRLKAGTAQKVVLNLLSTAIMTGLGGVHAGRMVDMRPRNDKLRRRAVAMVCDLTGCSADTAREALAECAMRIKPAILMVTLDLSVTGAHRLLAKHRGNLRSALAT